MRAVNLIPAEERSGGARFSAGRSGGVVYAIFALLAGLALLAVLYGSAAHQISGRKAEIASLQARTAQAQARTAALAPYTSFAALQQQREQAVEELVNSRFDWAHAFHELGRVLPTNVSLDSLEGKIGSVAAGGSGSSSSTSSSSTGKTGAASGASSVSSATPPGSVPIFTLAGCTTSQANVAVVLDRLRLIDGVQEVTLQSAAKSGSSGASAAAGSGTCGGGDVSFSATLTFDALPTIPTSGPATATVAATSSGAAR